MLHAQVQADCMLQLIFTLNIAPALNCNAQPAVSQYTVPGRSLHLKIDCEHGVIADHEGEDPVHSADIMFLLWRDC